MVHYVPPKRDAHQRSEKPSFDKLPDDLLLMIQENVSTRDMRNLRLVCKSVVGAAAESMARRLRCLYIHPSLTSLRNLPQVCDHPLFSNAIEEIVLLGEIPVQDMNRLLSKQSNPKDSVLRKMISPWPEHWPRTKSDRNDAASQKTQEVVLACLSELPGLRALSYDLKARHFGFNGVRRATIESHAKYALATRNEHPPTWNTDFDMLVAILNDPRLSFAQLAIRTVPASVNIDVQRLSRRSIQNLRRLELTVGGPSYPATFPMGKQWTMFCGDLLNQIGSQQHESVLEKLVLVKRRAYGKIMPNMDTTFHDLNFTAHIFPHLRCLEIKATPSLSNAPQRPICEESPGNLEAFISHHVAMSLANLTLDNILFYNSAFPDVLDESRHLARTMKALTCSSAPTDIAEETKTKKLLATCIFKIDRFVHHEHCKNSSRYLSPACHSYSCGRYTGTSRGGDSVPRVDVEDMERLAAEMGVECEEGKYWDFAKAAL